VLVLSGCGGSEFQSGAGGSSTTESGGSAGSGLGTGGQADACGSGSTCAPTVPDGWNGIATLYVGADLPSSCPGEVVAEVRAGEGDIFAPHTCSACECGPPAGVTCSAPVLELYGNFPCPGTPSATVTLTPDYCPQTLLNGVTSIQISSAVGGTCLASGGSIQKQEPIFENEALLCDTGADLAGPECDAGVCAPLPAAPFQSGYCVYRQGSAACPAGFPEHLLVYEGIDDDRECFECSCGSPAGASCAGAIQGYDNASCEGLVGIVPNDLTCHNITNMASLKLDPAAVGGACPPTGGGTAGMAKPVGPITVCCTQ
jgi:hypothetical protein